jgi:hypothetical protein
MHKRTYLSIRRDLDVPLCVVVGQAQRTEDSHAERAERGLDGVYMLENAQLQRGRRWNEYPGLVCMQ